MEDEENEIIEQETTIQPKFEKTNLAEKMDTVKVDILNNAQKDEQFNNTIKDNIKKMAVTATEVENEKQQLEKQQVVTEQKKEERSQTQVEHGKQEDIWEHRQKRRQYHYDGVKPIMTFVGINEPMNLIMLYALTMVLVWFFLLSKLWKGTIGALLHGACDEDRPKAMKGMLWTLFVVVVIGLIAGSVYLFLKWQNII